MFFFNRSDKQTKKATTGTDSPAPSSDSQQHQQQQPLTVAAATNKNVCAPNTSSSPPSSPHIGGVAVGPCPTTPGATSMAASSPSTPGVLSRASSRGSLLSQSQSRVVVSSPVSPTTSRASSCLSFESAHRRLMEQQRREIKAHEHQQLHKWVLRHSNQVNSVSRRDHRAMLKILVGEAYRADPHRKANRERWERLMRDMLREVDAKNSLLIVAADPYQAVMAKLSSMLVWNHGHQYWSYRYWEEEMVRRRNHQSAVLAELRRHGGFFLPQ